MWDCSSFFPFPSTQPRISCIFPPLLLLLSYIADKKEEEHDRPLNIILGAQLGGARFGRATYCCSVGKWAGAQKRPIEGQMGKKWGRRDCDVANEPYQGLDRAALVCP